MILLHFPISPAFEYVEIALNWFWPVVGVCSFLGLIWLVDACRN